VEKAKPSQQIIDDIEAGKITPAVDFWCYRKAKELAKLNPELQLARVQNLNSAIVDQIRYYYKIIIKN
jgi:hypothetical protein